MTAMLPNAECVESIEHASPAHYYTIASILFMLYYFDNTLIIIQDRRTEVTYNNTLCNKYALVYYSKRLNVET